MSEEPVVHSESEDRGRRAINRILCATLDGVNAKKIEVEATFIKGLPGFSVVGLASNEIQESRERVKAALSTNGFTFPPLKITINLSPSDIPRKSGTHFDLPIALLIALNAESIERRDLFVFGELGLDGRVKSSSMLFPLILSLKEREEIERAMVPREAMEYLSHIPGIEFVPVDTLEEAIEAISSMEGESEGVAYGYDAETIVIDEENYYFRREYPYDFIDVKGQDIAKRASLVAAAGMHNFLMEGSPGCGKSMIAGRLRYILPPMRESEILSVAKHAFLNGDIPAFDPLRPQRSPHHTATPASIFGGGSSSARIGEVALAHCGILFFDELPHFSKNVLEALREPMQDRRVNIARVNSKISYDADFMFVAAMNPCPCGNLLARSRSCRCSEAEIKRYRNRLSDPFLDRIDIFVVMQEVDASDRGGIDSATMHEKVLGAFEMQKRRGQSSLNGRLSESEIDRYCILEEDAQRVLNQAVSRFSLSHRSIVSIKKVSRSIADLDGSDTISKSHLLEALSFRRRR
jgi:magnesium chelatase family protein